MYLLETDDESVFFAGDTALTETTHHLVKERLWEKEPPTRYRLFRLDMLHDGSLAFDGAI